MSAETWMKVPGASDYDVSDRGQVRTGAAGGGWRLLHPTRDEGGRRYIIIVDDQNRRRNVAVARLVLLAHAGRPKKGCDRVIRGPRGVDYDGLTNVRWGTPAEQFASSRGTGGEGFENPANRTVTEAMARKYDTLVRQGKVTLRAAAKKEKVPRTTLANAIYKFRERERAAGARRRAGRGRRSVAA